MGENLSTGRVCLEFAIVGTIPPPLVSRFEATPLLSHLHILQGPLYLSHLHYWPYLYQYKADWSDIFLKNYLLVVHVSNWPSLEPYIRRLCLVSKLHRYYLIVTASKNLYIQLAIGGTISSTPFLYLVSKLHYKFNADWICHCWNHYISASFILSFLFQNFHRLPYLRHLYRISKKISYIIL